jgi:hypothetical protein
MNVVPATREYPIPFTAPMVRAILEGRKTQTRRVVKVTLHTPGLAACLEPADPAWVRPKTAVELCPYGTVGGRLWVKTGYYKDDYNAPSGRRFVSGRFMPRHMSPALLELTEVRIQRLQGISDPDIEAEGWPVIYDWLSESQRRMNLWCQRTRQIDPNAYVAGHKAGFAVFWDSINADRGYCWDSNPWVWALTFSVAEPAP